MSMVEWMLKNTCKHINFPFSIVVKLCPSWENLKWVTALWQARKTRKRWKISSTVAWTRMQSQLLETNTGLNQSWWKFRVWCKLAQYHLFFKVHSLEELLRMRSEEVCPVYPAECLQEANKYPDLPHHSQLVQVRFAFLISRTKELATLK